MREILIHNLPVLNSEQHRFCALPCPIQQICVINLIWIEKSDEAEKVMPFFSIFGPIVIYAVDSLIKQNRLQKAFKRDDVAIYFVGL
jgi:hypothetical protein